MAVKLGQKVKDVITGFEGTITGRAQYLTGCSQGLVAPPISKDGEHRDGHWFDEDRLAVVSEEIVDLKVVNPGPDKTPSRRY